MNKSKKIIIAGGAGYIGSHAVARLMDFGWEPVIIDNFSRGNRDIAERLGVETFTGDLSDETFLDQVFSKEKYCAVMHFAASSYVGESVTDPARYYRNNVGSTLALLSAMLRNKLDKLIFSSTCATYGIPDVLPINEKTQQSPVSPYGWSKLMIEQILRDYAAAYNLHFVAFRYFNAAGALPEQGIGERHFPETHLIPLAIASAYKGLELKVFGRDYPTNDGTCIRDYAHVVDIADAHRVGLDYLLNGGKSDFFNIGTGKGHSVQQVIDTVEKLSGKKVNFVNAPRREGDPAELVADAGKINSVLGWQPQYCKLEDIIQSAINWHLADGFCD